MKNYNLILTGSKSKSRIPHCIHGPNLLLEDLNETIPEYKRKYVCSAVRNNECKPFINFDLDRFKEDHFKKRKNFQNRLIQTLKSPENERRWCVDCSILVLSNELDQHENHLIKDGLTIKQLRLPTKLISANVDKKEEAQYFFSDQSLRVILKTIVRSKFSHVLCIGCPSIHEQITNRSKKLNIQSFLLDIDSRYLQFYSSKQFLCFNMANNFLFEKDKYETNLNQFIANSSKLLVIADPPFGIMIPALADTLSRLKKKINYFKKDDINFQMNMMLFHLYFYEKRIRNVLPELKMMDYKISYSNHKKMKQDGNSIARLFTDIDGKNIVLKNMNAYKFCKQCERWVHSISQHCPDCKNCCSKDGKTSVHCAVCDKCVRETYVHCFTCEMCTKKGQCKCGFNSKNKLFDLNDYCSDDEFNYHNDKNEIDNEDGQFDHQKTERYNNQMSNDDQQINYERENNGFRNDRSRNQNVHFSGNNWKSKSFNSGDRSFNSRDRSFSSGEKRFGSGEKRFGSGERRFGSRGGKFGSREGKLNSRERFNSGERKFNSNNFRRNSSFDHSRSRDDNISKDDFNNMFFSKNSGKKSARNTSSNRNSFNRSNRTGNFKRSNSFGGQSFKRARFNN